MSLDAAPLAPLDKIEWRVDSDPYERDGGMTCRYVPYVDAALVATLLDGWVGPDGWQDTYESTTVAGKEAMWCRLSILSGEWVTKTDIGVPSNMESQKGAVSDAFKRAACLKWGVARNVYEMPTVYAHCRTFTSNGKTKAAADGQRTLDDIATKLRSLGYDARGGLLRDHEAEQVAEEAEQVAVSPYVSADNAEALRHKCETRGVEVAEVVKLGTNGRTSDPAEVFKTEVGKVKEAFDLLSPAEGSSEGTPRNGAEAETPGHVPSDPAGMPG